MNNSNEIQNAQPNSKAGGIIDTFTGISRSFAALLYNNPLISNQTVPTNEIEIGERNSDSMSTDFLDSTPEISSSNQPIRVLIGSGSGEPNVPIDINLDISVDNHIETREPESTRQIDDNFSKSEEMKINFATKIKYIVFTAIPLTIFGVLLGEFVFKCAVRDYLYTAKNYIIQIFSEFVTTVNHNILGNNETAAYNVTTDTSYNPSSKNSTSGFIVAANNDTLENSVHNDSISSKVEVHIENYVDNDVQLSGNQSDGILENVITTDKTDTSYNPSSKNSTSGFIVAANNDTLENSVHNDSISSKVEVHIENYVDNDVQLSGNQSDVYEIGVAAV